MRCAYMLRRSYSRLVRPPLNLHPEELLSINGSIELRVRARGQGP
jgi:hypothetical protein